MTILDQLRAALEHQKRSAASADTDRLRLYTQGINHGLHLAIKIIDRFAAEHPGLIDRTAWCCNCGAPFAPGPHDFWLYQWGSPMTLDVALVGTRVWVDDPRIQGFTGMVLCAECAKLAFPDSYIPDGQRKEADNA